MPEPAPIAVTDPDLPFAMATYVTQTAQLLGLSIPPDQLASVIAHFERVQAIAQPILEFPLPDDLEAAPTFDPSFADRC